MFYNWVNFWRRFFVVHPLKIFIIFFSLVIVSVANAAELKIGYVQVDKILKEAPQTTESGKKLEKEFSPRSLE